MDARNTSPDLSESKELLFKFLFIGDYGVGKTAVIRRYTEDRFSPNYKITIGADFSLKNLQWDKNTKVSLQLWDIAGHERFGYMTRVYYKYAVAAAVVFDVSRMSTFESVQRWLADLREKVTLPDGAPIPVVLLANKCDIHSPFNIPAETIATFCKDNSINAWFFTSARENVNIEPAISYLIQRVLHLKAQERDNDTISLSRFKSRHGNRSNIFTGYCCG